MNGPGMNGPGMNGPGGRGMMMNGPGGRGMMMNGPGGRGISGPGGLTQQMGGMQIDGGQQMGGGMMQGGGQQMMGGGGQQMGAGMMPGPTGPECEVCHQGINGQIVQAYGKNYHPDHFVCEYCSQPFPGTFWCSIIRLNFRQGNKFMVAPDGKLYCEPDFLELHGKKCKVCNELISGGMINISDEAGGMMAFHSEHFICVCMFSFVTDFR